MSPHDVRAQWPTAQPVGRDGPSPRPGSRQNPSRAIQNRGLSHPGHQAAPLINVVMIAVCAVICGADDFVAIAEFGRKKREWPARFLDLEKGIPSHDRFNARIKNERLTAASDETYLEEVLVGN